ncbi:hypothetical protein [Rhizobium gallicum]|uniref:hypothetical protein n=1 Tax=Rhizobium gallicum TaxID=56730 RepID=UPI001EF9455C|nr:hypothetical protein [Rhizobium gallicum]ULJ74334.1 hypothetical protein L2W42_23340 [Rhizobium gallicum]
MNISRAAVGDNPAEDALHGSHCGTSTMVAIDDHRDFAERSNARLIYFGIGGWTITIGALPGP